MHPSWCSLFSPAVARCSLQAAGGSAEAGNISKFRVRPVSTVSLIRKTGRTNAGKVPPESMGRRRGTTEKLGSTTSGRRCSALTQSAYPGNKEEEAHLITLVFDSRTIHDLEHSFRCLLFTGYTSVASALSLRTLPGKNRRIVGVLFGPRFGISKHSQ